MRKRPITSAPFDSTRARLLERLNEMGVTLKEASTRLRRNHAYLHQYIFRGKPEQLGERERAILARLTGLSEADLGRPNLDDEIGPPDHIPSEVVARGPRSPDSIPLYGVVETGAGDVTTHWEVVEYVERPALLAGVKDAYAMYVIGDSMEPAFRRGNLVLINPNMPARFDDDVILLQEAFGKETPALLKRFIKSTPDQWIVEQFNPPKKIHLSKDMWRHCHVVVARYSR